MIASLLGSGVLPLYEKESGFLTVVFEQFSMGVFSE